MIAHPARKLHALFLQLIEQPLHPLRCLADLRAAQHAGCGVCHDKLQFFHCRAARASHENGHLTEIRTPFRNERPDGGRAPMAGDQAVFPILRFGDGRRVHDAGQRDAVFQLLQLVRIHGIEICLIAYQIVNIDLGQPLSGVRLGHLLQLLGKYAAHVKCHRPHLPSCHPSSSAAPATPERNCDNHTPPRCTATRRGSAPA